MSSDPASYNKGYAAGLMRKTKIINAERARRNETTLWRRYMAAALTECISSSGWKRGEEPITNVTARVALAADFADAALKESRARGRA